MISFKEFLAELSKDTLKSYKTKAEKDAADLKTVDEYKDIAQNLINRRKKGIKAAARKITESGGPQYVIRTMRGKAVGIIWPQTDGTWGSNFLPQDWGYDDHQSKEEAYEEIVDAFHDYINNRGLKLIALRPLEAAELQEHAGEGAKVRSYKDKDGIVKYEVLNSKGVTVKSGMSKDTATKYLLANRDTLTEGKGWSIDSDDKDEFTAEELAAIKNSHFPDKHRENLRLKRKQAADRAERATWKNGGGESGSSSSSIDY